MYNKGNRCNEEGCKVNNGYRQDISQVKDGHLELCWRPRQTKRSVGRLQRRWVDDIKQIAGRNWIKKAQDRHAWKITEKTYSGVDKSRLKN